MYQKIVELHNWNRMTALKIIGITVHEKLSFREHINEKNK